MGNQATRFVDSIPEHYDASLGPRIFVDYATDLARRVSRFGPSSVLEIAAGTGILTRSLRDRVGTGCRIVATDLNLPMLEIAKKKFGRGEQVRFETADALDLSFEGDSFDAVACQFGVMFFPDKDCSYREAYRVLRPGGRYFFNVWNSWSDNRFAEVVHTCVARFFPEDPPRFYEVPFSYHETDEISAAIRASGFSDVSAERVCVNAPVGDPHQFAVGLVQGNPISEEIAGRGGDIDTVCAAVADAIHRDLGEELQLSATVFEATKP